MYKKIALFVSILAIIIAQTNVTLACPWALLEEVETPEFLNK